MIRINGIEFASPEGFRPTSKPIYAGSMVNGNGVTISNYIGDKMSFNLTWDYMPLDDYDSLKAAIVTQPIIFEYMEDEEYISFKTRRTAGINKSEMYYNKQKKRYEWNKVNLKLEEL